MSLPFFLFFYGRLSSGSANPDGTTRDDVDAPPLVVRGVMNAHPEASPTKEETPLHQSILRPDFSVTISYLTPIFFAIIETTVFKGAAASGALTGAMFGVGGKFASNIYSKNAAASGAKGFMKQDGGKYETSFLGTGDVPNPFQLGLFVGKA